MLFFDESSCAVMIRKIKKEGISTTKTIQKSLEKYIWLNTKIVFIASRPKLIRITFVFEILNIFRIFHLVIHPLTYSSHFLFVSSILKLVLIGYLVKMRRNLWEKIHDNFSETYFCWFHPIDVDFMRRPRLLYSV